VFHEPATVMIQLTELAAEPPGCLTAGPLGVRSVARSFSTPCLAVRVRATVVRRVQSGRLLCAARTGVWHSKHCCMFGEHCCTIGGVLALSRGLCSTDHCCACPVTGTMQHHRCSNTASIALVWQHSAEP
jgi:hypothetical protein